MTEKTVAALGYFDGVHLGHQAVLSAALLRATTLNCIPAAFTFYADGAHPQSGKGRRDIQSLTDRISDLRSFGIQKVLCKPFSVISHLAPHEFFEQILLGELHAKAVCCGENFRFGRNASGDIQTLSALCSEYDVELITVPKVKIGDLAVSSSVIRDFLAQGDIPSAARCLGKQYSFTASVEHGRALGRRLGFPTINQFPDSSCLVPLYGVYASCVEIDGTIYPAVTNIGVKPTVESSSVRPNCETHILHFSGDLYGKELRVTLLRFIRGERQFANVKELAAAVFRDGETAQEIFNAIKNKSSSI